MGNLFSDDPILGEVFETLETLPKEIGTEAITQMGFGQQKQGDDNNKKDPNVAEQERKDLINALYGKSDVKGMPVTQMPLEQLQTINKQRVAQHRRGTSTIEQEIAAYRQKKQQEITAYERGMTQGTKGPKDQKEKMELWQEEQKKREEIAKKQKAATLPGSQQSRSGEQGVVMG